MTGSSAFSHLRVLARSGRWPAVTALRRLGADSTGIAAVEFALILPVLILLWIGGVEVTQALSVDRRVEHLSSAIADLAARSRELTYADVEAIFDLGPAAMYPYSRDATSMVLTAVDIDEDGAATVAWSRARGDVSPYADSADLTASIADNLRNPSTQVIMAEVYHSHSPTVGYAITGKLKLDDRAFYVPRVVPHIRLCDNAHLNCR